MLSDASGCMMEGQTSLSDPLLVNPVAEVLPDGLASALVPSPTWTLGSKAAPPASSFCLPHTLPFVPCPGPSHAGGS